MFSFAKPTPTERLMIAEETAAELVRRYGISEDAARRIVDTCRSVDQAYALAGLMK